MIFRFGEFFNVQDNELNVVRRKKGNDMAKKCRAIARSRAKLISGFPFVRAVLASGSFSKGYMDEKSDLDFFVITAPERLWISRTIIVLFKRLFFLNSHKYFCCNYFVDVDHLEIEEKNLFTATELATLIPLDGSRHHKKMIEANPWLKRFFPNFEIDSAEHFVYAGKETLKMLLEGILKAKFFDPIERLFMRMTLRRWKRLYEKKYNTNDFSIAFKSNEHVSKNHPNHYQLKVMRCYDEKLKNYNQQHEVELMR